MSLDPAQAYTVRATGFEPAEPYAEGLDPAQAYTLAVGELSSDYTWGTDGQILDHTGQPITDHTGAVLFDHGS